MMNLMTKLAVVVVSISLSTVFMVAPTRSASKVVTDGELALLPEYCAARLGGNKTQAYKNWNQRMGPKIFVDVHHYCFGLNFMSRAAMEFDSKNKKFILGQAIRNFDYVLRSWPKEFPLYSSALTYRQQAEMMLKLTR